MTARGRAEQITELLAQLVGLMADSTPTEAPAQPAVPTPARVLLTVEEAAERLHIGKTKTYALVKTGELESVLIGRLRRIHTDAVARFAARLVADQSSASRPAA